MECQNCKVHPLIKRSDCCLFTRALAHLSSTEMIIVNLRSLISCCHANTYLWCVYACVYMVKNQNRLLTSSHIHAQREANLINQSIRQQDISLRRNRTDTQRERRDKVDKPLFADESKISGAREVLEQASEWATKKNSQWMFLSLLRVLDVHSH